MRLALITLMVANYDDAISWFDEKLGFVLREDSDLGGGKRWVRMAPASGDVELLFARAVTAEQSAVIGQAGGGRVGFFLHSDDFNSDYDRMTVAGVKFLEEPRHERYGKVAVFVDLYGNKWDLVEAP